MKSRSSEGGGKYYIGHRKRMKEKFLSYNEESVTDYELMEMLLYLVYPRKDVKPIAKKLLQDFKSVKGLLCACADGRKYKKILSEYGQSVMFIAKITREITLRSFITEIKESTVLSSWTTMVEYLKVKFSSLPKEQFSVLYLDHKCQLIEMVKFGSGTVDESTVYVREIVKTGLESGAKQLILCHNHPSGNAEPSRADIELTNQITTACKTVNMTVLDHVIVSHDAYHSFREEGLM